MHPQSARFAKSPLRIPSTVFIVALILSISAGACRSTAPSQERRYHLEGAGMSIDKAQRSGVMDHKEIVGFMGAMTMPPIPSQIPLISTGSPREIKLPRTWWSPRTTYN